MTMKMILEAERMVNAMSGTAPGDCNVALDLFLKDRVKKKRAEERRCLVAGIAASGDHDDELDNMF